MTQFYTGGIENKPRSPLRASMGGLGSRQDVVTPAQARALAREFKRSLDSAMESSMADRVQGLMRNMLTKAATSTLLKDAINDLMNPKSDFGPQDNLSRDLHGQHGYTLLWAQQGQVCGTGSQDPKRFFWTGLDTHFGMPTCRSFGTESVTMEGASNLRAFKIYWEHSRNAFHNGTSNEVFEKTGVPGPVYKDRPRAGSRPFGRNKIIRTITALNPWSAPVGDFTDTKTIPNEFLDPADMIADETEPFAEARSRQEGEPRPAAAPRPQTETFTFGRGEPSHVREKGNPFPKSVKGKEGKNMTGIVAGSTIGRLLNEVTESLDVFNVLYDSLEWWCKPKGRTNQLQRIDLVIKNINCIDLDKLIEGLIWNEIEDRFIGQIAGSAAKESGKATGGIRGAIPSQFGKAPLNQLRRARDAIIVFRGTRATANSVVR